MIRPGPKTGLRAVAMRAQVSLATASRALAQPDLVSPDVRQRVQEACMALHYIPNRTARRLSQQRSETIGLIVPAIGNPLFAPTIDGVRSILDPRGYGLLINSAERDPAIELHQIRTLIEHGVDAILTMLPVHLPQTFELLEYAGVPAVFIATSGGVPPGIRVDYDNAGAMREMVAHVLAAGHRRVAVLSGPSSISPVVGERLLVACAALAEAGCAPPEGWIVETGYAVSEMRRGARRLLQCPEQPTAIICTGDQHAVATIVEARSLGVAVPEQVSVTGCNGVDLAELCHPDVTTQRLPYRELGEVAGQTALDLLAGIAVATVTTLPHRLISRSSVAAPAKDINP